MILNQTANVVLVPSNLRMEVFQQIWLVKNKVVSESSTGFFTPVAVQCSDHEVDVLILPGRVQIVGSKPDLADALTLAADRMNLLAQAGQTALLPLQAGGLNIQLILDVKKPQQAVRRAFFPKSSRLFDKNSLLTDVTISVSQDKNGDQYTVKLAGVKNETGVEGLMLDFNCHVAISTIDDVAALGSRVKSFVEFCRERTDLIVKEVNED